MTINSILDGRKKYINLCYGGYIMEFYQINRENIFILEEFLVDLAEYHNYVSDCFKGSFPSKPFNEIFFSIQKDITEKRTFIEAIKENKEIIGFYQCSVKDKIGELNYLYIKPNKRNKGYGSILINRAFKYMKSFNINRIDILVVHGNSNAINFYKKRGFNIRFNIMSRFEGE